MKRLSFIQFYDTIQQQDISRLVMCKQTLYDMFIKTTFYLAILSGLNRAMIIINGTAVVKKSMSIHDPWHAYQTVPVFFF